MIKEISERKIGKYLVECRIIGNRSQEEMHKIDKVNLHNNKFKRNNKEKMLKTYMKHQLVKKYYDFNSSKGLIREVKMFTMQQMI